MYNNFETELSRKFLEKIFDKLEKPFILLGGWATYFLVNERFKNSEGKEYLGSKDLDIGFYMEKDWNKKQLTNSDFAKNIKLLEDMGFRFMGFRLLQEFHTETKKNLSLEDAKKTSHPFITSVYIDPIVNIIPKGFKNIFGFIPIDEPLLDLAFKGRTINMGNLILPTPEVMLAMKLNSVLNRNKIHKKTKDICDIFALLQYSNISIKEFLKIYERKKALEIIIKLDHSDISGILGVDKMVIKGAFENIKEEMR